MIGSRCREAPGDGIVGTDQEIRTDLRELICGGKHKFTHALLVPAVDACHVFGERMSVDRDLGMAIEAEKLCAFNADGAITKSGPFGGTGNDADVASYGANYSITRIL